jgi:hypothetical protein
VLEDIRILAYDKTRGDEWYLTGYYLIFLCL